MRQGQQNRRGRGRNRNKGQNPLTRSFESNGPGGHKIRGTPALVAEKYISLARDALSSGDPVLAENYLQHAEHYNRIIMAYREQNAQAVGEHGGAQPQRMQQGGPGDYGDGSDDGDDEFMDNSDGFRNPPRVASGTPEHDPQPRIDHRENRAEGDGMRRPQRRPQRHRPDRGDRPDQHRADQRSDRGRDHDQRPDRGREHDQDRQSQPYSAAPVSDEQPSNGRLPHDEQPEFLRRPIRRPRREQNGHGERQSDTRASGDPAEEAID
ncbi:MAG: hypothetical protein RLZ98_2501 [Pseudomonadota bacterium]|jgi:hypothetical protein